MSKAPGSATDRPERGVDGPLDEFIALAVQDDYRTVADDLRAGERDAAPAGRWPRPRLVGAAAVAVAIGLIAAVAILSVRSTDDSRARTHDELAQRVAVATAEIDERQAAVEQATDRVADLRSTLASSAATTQEAALIANLDRMAGTSVLTGPGLTVTIHDAPDAAAGSLNRVLDRDLQLIVNALWKMGASGIAINGQRLTGQSAIRGAGQAILVDYRPVLAPYRIDAVGTATTGPEDNDLVHLLTGLREAYGLDSTVSAGDVALPAGEVRAPRFASTTTTAEPDSTATIEPGGTP